MKQPDTATPTEPVTEEASPQPSLHVFCAQGEYEAHWLVARDLDDARKLLGEWIEQNWSESEIRDWREYHAPDPDPWVWHSLDDGAELTMNADDDDEETMPASGWVARNGRGHLTWGEIW